jgi:hypothetical protein
MANHTITNLCGEAERVSLPQPHYEAAAQGEQDYTGVWITGIFSGPRTGRRFVRTYSIWQRSHNDGRCVGTTIREIDEAEYLNLCERVDTDPVNVTAADV